MSTFEGKAGPSRPFSIREAVRTLCLQALEELSERFLRRLCDETKATQHRKNIAAWGGVGWKARGTGDVSI